MGDQLKQFGYNENEIMMAMNTVKDRNNINDILVIIESEIECECKLEIEAKMKEIQALKAMNFEHETKINQLSSTNNDHQRKLNKLKSINNDFATNNNKLLKQQNSRLSQLLTASKKYNANKSCISGWFS